MLVAININFNGPRAGISFNDGFGGANDVSQSLIFNMCRESGGGDLGPIQQPGLQRLLSRTSTGRLPEQDHCIGS